MWTKKSSDEIGAERRAGLIRSIFFLAVLFGLSSLLFSLAAAAVRRPVSVAGATVIGGIFSVMVLGFIHGAGAERRRNFNKTVVCDRCNAVKTADGQSRCACGGDYHRLADMKWNGQQSSQPPSAFKHESLA